MRTTSVGRDSAPSPQHAAAVERARELVRAAIREQNLPGVSVAVAAGLLDGALAKEGLPSAALAKEGGAIVWAEGFGWRDVDTRTPVTPNTRFNIGTAASAVTTAAVARLGLTSTGAESAVEWSPKQIGEPGEEFPPLTSAAQIAAPTGRTAPDRIAAPVRRGPSGDHPWSCGYDERQARALAAGRAP